MDDFAIDVFLHELQDTLVIACGAIHRLNSEMQNPDGNNRNVFFFLDQGLHYAARASLILWPEGRGDRRRGKALREILDIPETNLLKERKLRNHLQHFDERIDQFLKASPERRLMDRIIGPSSDKIFKGDKFHTLRRFDPNTKEYEFAGEVFLMTALVKDWAFVGRKVEEIIDQHAVARRNNPAH